MRAAHLLPGSSLTNGCALSIRTMLCRAWKKAKQFSNTTSTSARFSGKSKSVYVPSLLRDSSSLWMFFSSNNLKFFKVRLQPTSPMVYDRVCLFSHIKGGVIVSFPASDVAVAPRWRPPTWEYPNTDVLDFSNLLVPTMDSTRALFLLRMLHKQRKAVLMVGAEGTAKTSTALMFFSELDPVKTAVKRHVFEIKTNRYLGIF